MLTETRISHLVKSEDLNHHGTLFAGRLASWMVEACFIAATRFQGDPEDVVCVKIHGMSFDKPSTKGDIVEIKTKLALAGTKSLTVFGQAFINLDEKPAVTGWATFVTVDEYGKAYAHGLKLPPEYVEANREVCDLAARLRSQK